MSTAGWTARSTGRARARRTGVAAMCVALLASLAACTTDSDQPPLSPDPVPAPRSEDRLTLAVWGNGIEIDTYERLMAEYSARSDTSEVEVVAFSDREEAMDALEAGEVKPDVFMASRRDLSRLREDERTIPVDELLDERFVEFGDGYARDALLAFSADQRLQCMPFEVSPTVVYYNTDLIDFERMRERGLDAPTSPSRWSFDQFREAAEFATRPRRGTKGVHVDPSLAGLAPFVYAGGGDLFADGEPPTSLAFSEESTREALERTLELLRSGPLTLSDRQLERAPALEWFRRGKLAMITGDRTWVPRLRVTQGLGFDVMPIPTIDTTATTGELIGFCLARRPVSLSGAADLLVHLISDDVVRPLTRSGYLVPANQQVALSEDFIQTGRQPFSSTVFTESVDDMVVPPLLDAWGPLQRAVDELVETLVTAPGVLDLESVTAEIDLASQLVLAPAPVVGEDGEPVEESQD
jgi:multiple sugar transport system substrate-binding protein